MTAGFLCIAGASLLNAQYTSTWSATNYYRSELLMGVGQSFAFIGLMAGIVMQALFSGALSKPQSVLTFSAFFHVVRLFGGQIGVAVMTHFIAIRERVHSNLLGLHVQGGEWVTDTSVHQLTADTLRKSASCLRRPDEQSISLPRVSAYKDTRSRLLTGFHIISWACVAALASRGFSSQSLLDSRRACFRSAGIRIAKAMKVRNTILLVCVVLLGAGVAKEEGSCGKRSRSTRPFSGIQAQPLRSPGHTVPSRRIVHAKDAAQDLYLPNRRTTPWPDHVTDTIHRDAEKVSWAQQREFHGLQKRPRC